MPSPARRTSAALLLVVGLLASLLAATVGSTAVAATEKGIANGGITCPRVTKCPGLTMLWFDKDWNYINQRKLGAGARGYSLTLPAGTYHLQFVDQRPSYDVSKYAPTDVKVTVRANDLTVRNLTMQRGSAITGTVKGGGKPMGGATLRAANQAGQSYATTANDKGQFAIGGLPAGKYSVFTWDKRKVWVGKSTWAGAVSPSKFKNVKIRLGKKAGQMSLYLFTPDGLLTVKNTLTVTSKETGQWWSATSGNGTFSFKGLYPGRYTAKFEGAGVWFPKTGAVEKAVVRSNGYTSGSFRLTKRGGWLRGHLVDGDGQRMVALKPGYTNGPGATVRLFNAAGDQIATATSDSEGQFILKGQLATQDGLTIVVEPPPGGYLRGEGYCQFDRAEFDGYSLVTGKEWYIGQLAIPRTEGQKDPACATIGADRARERARR
ncbi:carboxypeptidase-like regulatory domain-containing protein [Nocardioides caricicola]|uniref:Carboxypeptidase-like regulatory domain-containing protein n=1 Tax=Nocardioides caricicola TaxID=634770 RepID=A0ABW0MTU0_9ACTN